MFKDPHPRRRIDIQDITEISLRQARRPTRLPITLLPQMPIIATGTGSRILVFLASSSYSIHMTIIMDCIIQIQVITIIIICHNAF